APDVHSLLAAVALLALARCAMSNDICPLAVGAMEGLHDHDVTRSEGGCSDSHIPRENSRPNTSETSSSFLPTISGPRRHATPLRSASPRLSGCRGAAARSAASTPSRLPQRTCSAPTLCALPCWPFWASHASLSCMYDACG